MSASDQRVIATCGILSVAVGSANSIYKDGRMPSSRFLIGSGVAYLILSALSEGEPELAKGLALGVLTTIVLGEGGGVLSYISHGEIDTQKRQTPADDTTDDNLTPDRGAGPQAGGVAGVAGSSVPYTVNGQTQQTQVANGPVRPPKPHGGPRGGGGGGGGPRKPPPHPAPGPVQYGGSFSRDVIAGIPGIPNQ